jgi:hypothetical protein
LCIYRKIWNHIVKLSERKITEFTTIFCRQLVSDENRSHDFFNCRVLTYDSNFWHVKIYILCDRWDVIPFNRVHVVLMEAALSSLKINSSVCHLQKQYLISYEVFWQTYATFSSCVWLKNLENIWLPLWLTDCDLSKITWKKNINSYCKNLTLKKVFGHIILNSDTEFD